MRNFIIIGALAIGLAACASDPQKLIVREYRVVEIPKQYIDNCPRMVELPRYSKLTNVQASKLIATLHKAYRECRGSVEAIDKYLQEAKRLIEEGKAIN